MCVYICIYICPALAYNNVYLFKHSLILLYQENILHYTCARGNLLEIQENVRHANKHDINQHDKVGNQMYA